MARARTLVGTVLGSRSGWPVISSMHAAQRQARRRSRAGKALTCSSSQVIVMVERNRPTISSGIGMRRTWHDARVTTTLPRVRLIKPLERSVRAGHPWIYADAIAVGDGERAGAKAAGEGGARGGRGTAQGHGRKGGEAR